ncbi:hypothetical protein ACJZ2D_011416 [Fusarium nematophilum]
MAKGSPETKSINVFARWRPLSEAETSSGEIDHRAPPDPQPPFSISIKRRSSAAERPWTSSAAFHSVFGRGDNNSRVYDAVVAPSISKVLHGESCSFFAYGHSGSGKTHTILGDDFGKRQELGMCLAASKQLFEAFHRLHRDDQTQELGVGFSLFELRQKSAFDLLNGGTECHVREGPDGEMFDWGFNIPEFGG